MNSVSPYGQRILFVFEERLEDWEQLKFSGSSESGSTMGFSSSGSLYFRFPLNGALREEYTPAASWCLCCKTIALWFGLDYQEVGMPPRLWGAWPRHIAPERYDSNRRRRCAKLLGHHVFPVVIRSIDMSAIFIGRSCSFRTWAGTGVPGLFFSSSFLLRLALVEDK